MTPHWHDGAIETLPRTDAPVAWSVPADGPAARAALACALIGYLAAIDPRQVRLTRSALGAPRVAYPPDWHLGLSGRDAKALIGVARQPIAVDREPLDDSPPLRDVLSPDERIAIDRLPDADRPLDWLRRWTIKEAHAKLIGDPLRVRPEAIETRLDDATHATATFEGISRCWTRRTATAVETMALWT